MWRRGERGSRLLLRITPSVPLVSAASSRTLRASALCALTGVLLSSGIQRRALARHSRPRTVSLFNTSVTSSGPFFFTMTALRPFSRLSAVLMQLHFMSQKTFNECSPLICNRALPTVKRWTSISCFAASTGGRSRLQVASNCKRHSS